MAVNKVVYGTSTIIDISDTTATADKVLQGYDFYDAGGVKQTGTAAGGGSISIYQDQDGYVVLDDEAGSTVAVTPLSVTSSGTYTAPSGVAYSPITVSVSGASNIVTGTFKGTTTGAAMDITLNYSGSGYPVAVAIYPTAGYGSDTDFYSTLQIYAFVMYSAVKRTHDIPTYATSGDNNAVFTARAYKSSSTTASSISVGSAGNVVVFSGSNANSSVNTVVTFKNNTTMSVFIASNSYGFAANVEYTYWVLYSS